MHTRRRILYALMLALFLLSLTFGPIAAREWDNPPKHPDLAVCQEFGYGDEDDDGLNITFIELTIRTLSVMIQFFSL